MRPLKSSVVTRIIRRKPCIVLLMTKTSKERNHQKNVYTVKKYKLTSVLVLTQRL